MFAAYRTDFFGLGQNGEAAMLNPHITAPVIPQDVPLKCSFDPDRQMWACSYESWWKQPSIYMLGVAALAAFGFGFAVGSSGKLQKAVKQAREAVPL